jgi:hypothetical protein
MHRAQRVGVPGVGGPREREVPEAELPDVTEPLVEAAVDDRLLVVRDRDGAVDRISDSHGAER